MIQPIHQAGCAKARPLCQTLGMVELNISSTPSDRFGVRLGWRKTRMRWEACVFALCAAGLLALWLAAWVAYGASRAVLGFSASSGIAERGGVTGTTP